MKGSRVAATEIELDKIDTRRSELRDVVQRKFKTSRASSRVMSLMK